MYRLFYILLSAFLWPACSCSGSAEGPLPEAPDYSDPAMWYSVPGIAPVYPGEKAVDVFYITPTCIRDWKDDRDRVSFYMDVENEGQRKAVDASNLLAYALFGKYCTFFSPYYRQISMESWSESPKEIERRYELAHSDIVRAFRHYMDKVNNGRPFILAGHSQGGKAVLELLKHTLTPQDMSRMVAAYVFGFGVSSDVVEEYGNIRPASGADDTGVTICWNSVSRIEARSCVFDGNVLCINPVNWCTDGRYAPASANAGSVFFNREGQSDTLFHRVGVKLDEVSHTLVIDGLDDDDYYIPSIGNLFPKGNYHVQEINLYFLEVQENLRNRIEKYQEQAKNL